MEARKVVTTVLQDAIIGNIVSGAREVSRYGPYTV